jgi:molecular chaperone HtpG
LEFTTVIEKKASGAPSLEAFSRSSLYAIKDSVAKLLETIGREGIFREYTRHDISHIDKLLEVCGWLVPPGTINRMTTADCLMTTLAIYFHDLGMVVTRDEFDRRNESGFIDFKEMVLFGGDEGKDYKNKTERMSHDEAERFLYQEFVRDTHAQRIRAWVVGKNPKHLGAADQVVKELDKLLEGLGEKFRRDLGLVCESHHLDDLDNLDKYKPSQPYGSHAEEAANLQYAAILLRAADLLHVTRDRTPSISFRIINPSDPKSIEEWHKQMAVVTVRPKPSLDKDGNVDPKAQMDAVEVHGYFTEPEGYFALTGYLNYARRELRRCNEWAQLAGKKKGSKHEFPWRDVDDSNCEAQGFVDKQFEFTLDQARILDLLTGHTLYNDTTVVLRELVQNSLDAIRLQWEGEASFVRDGEVRITWNTKKRELTIDDNGTGMTQDVIDKHFLKVGSSLYQDDEFRKQHPAFSAISRFGIGVLSAFMISDEIEVTTSHPDDEQARTLSLRSLHGKYLIKLVDKDATSLPSHIATHGTRVMLKVRSSAELKDLISILEQWIVFPRCGVSVVIDGALPVPIGFREPKDALRHGLVKLGLLKGDEAMSHKTSPRDQEIKIEQRSKGGVTLAYAVRWSSYFREWEFLEAHLSGEGRQKEDRTMVGNCIEGVRVDFSTPGYPRPHLFAIANSVGPTAPKTNVARSGLERTPERRLLFGTVYELYCDHVRDEIVALQKERSFSLTWASEEASWLMAPLFSSTSHRFIGSEPSELEALLAACADIPSVPVEEHGSRVALSPAQLAQHPSFWTVDSAFFSSAEALIKEIPSPVAITSLAESLGAESLKLPPGPYVSVQSRQHVQRLVFRSREVDQIVIRREQRRIDLRWVREEEAPRWREGTPKSDEARRFMRGVSEDWTQSVTSSPIYIANAQIECQGRQGEIALRSIGRTFILPGTTYCSYLLKLLNRLDTAPDAAGLASYVVALASLGPSGRSSTAVDIAKRRLARMERHTPYGYFDGTPDDELLAILESTKFIIFDPRAWTRGMGGGALLYREYDEDELEVLDIEDED